MVSKTVHCVFRSLFILLPDCISSHFTVCFKTILNQDRFYIHRVGPDRFAPEPFPVVVLAHFEFKKNVFRRLFRSNFETKINTRVGLRSIEFYVTNNEVIDIYKLMTVPEIEKVDFLLLRKLCEVSSQRKLLKFIKFSNGKNKTLIMYLNHLR